MVRRSLIYQCWTGPMRSGVEASVANMRAYADRIGAEHRFDRDPNIAGKLCDVPAYFEWLNPILDERFLEYDQVLAVDCDVFAVEGLTESIFDCEIEDVGICTEPYQPDYRAKLAGHISAANDERWAREVKRLVRADMPRNGLGQLKVYNAGMVLFSRAGLLKARAQFTPFQEYIDAMRKAGLSRFYCVDQNYFHAMMVKHLNFTELHNGWNSYVHYVGSPDEKPRPVNDSRDASTRFVHIQLRGADDFDAEKLWRITNRPQYEWML